MNSRHMSLALFALISASPALAEVSDKIPSLTNLWAWAFAWNAIALLLGWKRPLMGLLVVPFAAFLAWGGHDMVTGAAIGPAILREQGQGYVDTVYLTGAIGVIGPVLLVLALAAWRAKAEK